jgi:hypothetical protein
MTITAPQQAEPEVARRVEEAKEPATPAAGPYGHPFHPILVTVPIGAWIASVVFDLAGRASTDGSAAMVRARTGSSVLESSARSWPRSSVCSTCSRFRARVGFAKEAVQAEGFR